MTEQHVRAQLDHLGANLAAVLHDIAGLDPDAVHRFGDAYIDLVDTWAGFASRLVDHTPLPGPRARVDVDTAGRL